MATVYGGAGILSRKVGITSLNKNMINTFLYKKVLFVFELPSCIILPSVLYWCEIWSLTLREGRKFRVFEKRVLRRIF
jgi:hypothetical protein